MLIPAVAVSETVDGLALVVDADTRVVVFVAVVGHQALARVVANVVVDAAGSDVAAVGQLAMAVRRVLNLSRKSKVESSRVDLIDLLVE